MDCVTNGGALGHERIDGKVLNKPSLPFPSDDDALTALMSHTITSCAQQLQHTSHVCLQ